DGADPSPLRDEGVVGDEDHGALLDRHRDPLRRRVRAPLPLLLPPAMSGWADRLIASGRADGAMVAQAERGLEAAALRAGDPVLDVGPGRGLLTLAAHDRIGDGWVIAIDPSVDALEELLALA